MSADREIDAWLRELGYGSAEDRARARAVLEEKQLTRPGKHRMSEEKLPRAQAALGERFFVHCDGTPCVAAARQSGRAMIHAESKARCESCGGSDNRRAETAFLEACQARGIRKLVVVGGSPSVREELSEVLGDALELRAIDGTERRTTDRAYADVEWADLVLIWGASELHHKVSRLYTQIPPPLSNKVFTVAKRGIAALLSEAIAHLRR